jgi:hypothetical protein
MPGISYQTKPGLPSGCQVNIKCFYAKSTRLGSNYRNISRLTLVQKVIPGYLQRTVDNYSRAYLWLISHDLSHGDQRVMGTFSILLHQTSQCSQHYTGVHLASGFSIHALHDGTDCDQRSETQPHHAQQNAQGLGLMYLVIEPAGSHLDYLDTV